MCPNCARPAGVSGRRNSERARTSGRGMWASVREQQSRASSAPLCAAALGSGGDAGATISGDAPLYGGWGGASAWPPACNSSCAMRALMPWPGFALAGEVVNSYHCCSSGDGSRARLTGSVHTSAHSCVPEAGAITRMLGVRRAKASTSCELPTATQMSLQARDLSMWVSSSVRT